MGTFVNTFTGGINEMSSTARNKFNNMFTEVDCSKVPRNLMWALSIIVLCALIIVVLTIYGYILNKQHCDIAKPTTEETDKFIKTLNMMRLVMVCSATIIALVSTGTMIILVPQVSQCVGRIK